MARTVAIGIQDFSSLIEKDLFYVDKTDFIKRWWDGNDEVTLITRPRRFGKTLTMSMLERFFSVKYAEKPEVFYGLKIWEDERFRGLQGKYPVIFLSFAKIKENNYLNAEARLCDILSKAYVTNKFLLETDIMLQAEKKVFEEKCVKIKPEEAADSLNELCRLLSDYYGRKVIILLDEYDTPVQEAYVNGFWPELVNFTRNLFNATFKTNPYLERAIMTGITRVSKESIFSDLNNLTVVTTTTDEYADCFGFTEEEVKAAAKEMGYQDFDTIKHWYDGFIFGKQQDIYNPWSIINFLKSGKVGAYWANSSSNSLVSKLIREGSIKLKQDMETLYNGGSIKSSIDEQIVYDRLDTGNNAIWSLLLASGYLKVIGYDNSAVAELAIDATYELTLTNLEVKSMLRSLMSDWFANTSIKEGQFIEALLSGDVKMLNIYMNEIAIMTFSSFDVGTRPSEKAPERFYHGFVLGLMAEYTAGYVLTSNRESGYGRYDVMMEPRDKNGKAVIIEFKVFDDEKEENLEDTLASALSQIEEKKYDQVLIDRGILPGHILKYGFVFEGKKVLIGEG